MSDVPLLERPWAERRLIGVVAEASDGRSWRELAETVTQAASATADLVGSAAKATAGLTRKAAVTSTQTATAAGVLASQTGASGAAAVTAGKAAAGAAAGAAASTTTAAAGLAASVTGAASAAAAATGAALGALVTAPAVPAVLATGAVAAAGHQAWKWWRGSAEDALIQVPAAALAGATLPPGHPRPGCVYAVHPLEPARYVPARDYHRLLLAEKAAALDALLTALGARSWQVFDGDTAQGPLQQRPPREPAAPAPSDWLAHEPAWQALVAQRLAGQGGTFAVALSWTDDHGLPAELSTGLRKAGWDTGPADQDYRPRALTVRGTFGG